MRIFYSWQKMYRKSGGSSKRIVLMLKAMVTKRMPKNEYDPIYRYLGQDFSGQSFLLDPETLLHQAYKYSYKEVADYIGLASFRNYAYYSATRDPSLELLHSPLSEFTINKNRLLEIKDGRIHFKFEKS